MRPACFTTLVLIAAGVTSGSGPTVLVWRNLRAKTGTNHIDRTTQIERNKVRPKTEEREIHRVEVQLTESYNPFLSRRLTMQRRRCFSNASSKQILSLVLGMKLCGAGGLMVDSTCECEEYSPDRRARFVKNFRPLGDGLGSVLAGSFDVHQELIEYTEGMRDVAAIILMSFSPARPGDEEPAGSFLWQIEPARPDELSNGACWTELINTAETRSRRLPELRIKRGARWVFQLGHNRLMKKAAERIAEILNTGITPL